MTDNLSNQNPMVDNREKLKEQSKKMSNEINTIVNQEISKEKEYVINTESIHVMPSSFLPQSPKKQLTNKQKIILAVIGFVLFLIVVIGVMLWVASRSIPKLPAEENANNNQQANQPVDQPVVPSHDEKISNDLDILNNALKKYFTDFSSYPSSLTNLSSYLSEVPKDPQGLAYQYESLVNGDDFRIVVEFDGSDSNNRVGLYKLTKSGGLSSYNPNENNLPISPPPPITNPTSTTSTVPFSPPPPPTNNNNDLDSDQLTQGEELIYNTNANDDDSDNDGFKDGSEIINLYNPLVSGDLLINSSLVTIFSDANYGFSIFRPRNWIARSLDNQPKEIDFLPDSETGEFISLTIFDNSQNLTLTQWSEQVDLPLLTGSWVGFSLGKTQGLPALRTTDGYHVLFVNNSYAYLLSYNVEENSQPNFSSTFSMMLNSFQVNNE